MATNPLLLTSMALLLHTGIGLPHERAELYNRLLHLLLETWRVSQLSGGVPSQDRDKILYYELDESWQSVQRRLQDLALWMSEHERREIRILRHKKY